MLLRRPSTMRGNRVRYRQPIIRTAPARSRRPRARLSAAFLDGCSGRMPAARHPRANARAAPPSPDAPVRRHHLRQRVPALPRAAGRSRSRSCRGSAAPRPCGRPASCSSRRRSSPATRTADTVVRRLGPAAAGEAAHGPAAALARVLPIIPRRGLEAGRRRESVVADPRDCSPSPSACPTSCCRRRARWCRRGLRARAPARKPVSAVRAVESRVDAGAPGLSVPARAVVADAHAGARLVGGIRALRRVVRGRRLDEHRALAHAAIVHASTATRHRRVPASRRAPPDARAPAAVVHARGDRLAAAARGVEPHHAEHRVGAAAVDRAARDLPAHVHPLLRRRAAGTGATSSSRCSPRGARREWHGRSPTRGSTHRARRSRSASSASGFSSPACSATASSRG